MTQDRAVPFGDEHRKAIGVALVEPGLAVLECFLCLGPDRVEPADGVVVDFENLGKIVLGGGTDVHRLMP
jgi:hypothetical protein